MKGTRSVRAQFIDGFVICFLAAAATATIALNLGLSVGPGKILPATLSMRTGDMSENIIAGLKVAENDVARIKSGLSSAEAWELISDRNLDLFFFIALLLPQSLTKAVLTIGYFLRFGLAASLMYAFCCRHAGLRRLYSFLLGMMYAFSSQVVLTAQFTPVMNMVILIPCALSAFDSYLRTRTWKSFALSALACALIAASGSYGCISGIPFLIVSSLVLSIGLYSRKRKVFSSWMKLWGAIITGTAMAAFSVIPRFIGQVPKFDVVQAAKTAEMRYDFYDLLRHMFVAQSGGLENDMPPVFYIGILTVEALILFWFNFKIPVRVKVTAAFVISVWYISCASSFVSGAVSIFGESPVLSSTRLICLEAFLFFYAAIALKNISGVERGALYASFLIPLGFLVFSGNNYTDIQFSTTINLGTGIVMLVCGIINSRLALQPSGKKFKMFVAVLGALAITVNASFIMFNNSVSASGTGLSAISDAEEDDDDLFGEDEDIGLSVFSNADNYLLFSEDISSHKADSFADGFNYASGMAQAGECFSEYDLAFVYSDQADHKEKDIYSVGAGFSSITFEITCKDGDRLFVYSGFGGDITIRNTNGEFEEETDISGPSLCELEATPGKHELAFFFDLEEASESRLAVMRVNPGAAERLQKATRAMNKGSFSFKYNDIPGMHAGPVSLLTSKAYDPGTRISVNGKTCRTFEYLGLTGCAFVASDKVSDYNVQISKVIPGLSGGITLSVAVCLAILAIPVIYKYSNKNKKGTRSEDPDLLEQPEADA
ncbi:MAG: YfhO family protein [Clostridiales bacterium]|nr:YfhO family protein [Clostridiales bacterium]